MFRPYLINANIWKKGFKPGISLNIFIQNFSNMQHTLYTIHSKWDWDESKMLIEFLSLSRELNDFRKIV